MRNHLITDIVLIRFPELEAADVARIRRIVAPVTPHRIPPAPFEGLDAEAALFFDELSSHTDHQLERCYQYYQSLRHRNAEEDHPFNAKEARATAADYDHWCKLDYWTLDECSALLIGRKPEATKFAGATKEQKNAAIAVTFLRTFDLLKRASETGQFQFKSSPNELLTWATGKRMRIPEALLVAADENGLLCVNSQTNDLPPLETQSVGAHEADDLSPQQKAGATKRIETLLKLFLATAIDGHGFAPEEAKSGFPGELQNAMAEIGWDIDVGTIRNHLSDAKLLLPLDYCHRSGKLNTASES